MTRLALAAVLVWVAILSTMSVAADVAAKDQQKWTQQIATIKAVGSEGAGTAQAQQAWKQLSQADVTAIWTILWALDDANPLAANWLRASVDAIAERQLRNGGKLPKNDLEVFTLDTKHSPRARRLAFDWLCRADTTAADRLIPSMLNDPGLEFRRDAVARVIAEAEQYETEKNPIAHGEYKKALTWARDLDQVQQIVKKLEGYGDKVDLTRHFGYLVKWKLIGPFDNTDEKGFDVLYPPEVGVDYKAEYDGKSGKVKWIDYTSEDPYGKVDLNKALEKANATTGYAAAEFMAEKPTDVEIRLTSTNANKIWLNGELLTRNNVYHAGEQMDQYIGKGKMKAGRNIILVKVLQNHQKESWAQDWNFQLRVCDASGTAILSQDRVARDLRRSDR
ncbi:MAG TPA: hypothetical protein VHD36_09110 [Pirellulales bacterium]|nr:hypothetical protein [Pirellulales bacterium]